MGSRRKLVKFQRLHYATNAFEFDRDDLSKKFVEWTESGTKVILELAAGKADYTLGLAELYPKALVIAVDIQGERLWAGSRRAKERNLDNAFFVRAPIETLTEFVPQNSIAEIWITFPDPFPRKGDAKKRLTSPRFLESYQRVLNQDGVVHLKTDDPDLFEYSVETAKDLGVNVLEELRDIYANSELPPELEIKTDFEYRHLQKGRKINYFKFGFDPNID